MIHNDLNSISGNPRLLQRILKASCLGITFLGVPIVLAVGVAYAADTPPPAQAPAKGLDAVLGTVTPGMAFADFLAGHPDAVYSDTDLQDTDPNPDQPGGLLLEWDADPWLGLECIADIGFKEAKLYEFVAMWKGDAAPAAAARERFFRECLRKNGSNFKREALRLHPGSTTEEMIPVLCWETGGVRLLAYYTPPIKGAPSNKAVFTYACFRKEDATVSAMLCGTLLTESQKTALWRDLESFLSQK